VATVVGQPELVNVHLLVVAGVVGMCNAVLALPAIRIVRWAITGPQERVYA